MTCDDCEEGRVEIHCSTCNGSGEGMADGTICRECRGWGGYVDRCDTCGGTGEVEQDEDENEIGADTTGQTVGRPLADTRTTARLRCSEDTSTAGMIQC